MNSYVIIDIEQNTIDQGQEVLVIKANPVKASEGMAFMEKMFGKKYATYGMNECDETEVFMLPFSEELAQRLIRLARKHEDGEYWEPNMDVFTDASLKTQQGIITVHKSTALVRKKIQSSQHTYIPPVAEWQFKHRDVNGLKVISCSPQRTEIKEEPNGGFSWNSGEMTFFVFSDDEQTKAMLNEALKLDPHKRQFWVPNESEFFKTRISMNGPFGSTEHDLFISYDLPIDDILDNLQAALW